MKCISIRQPWASLIIAGIKPVENRTWVSNYRGQLLIHTGKKYDYDGEMWIMNNFKYNTEMVKAFEKARPLRGGIIGTVDMVGCVKEHPSPWFFGPYGFVFENPVEYKFFPCPGQLGIFNVDDHIGLGPDPDAD